MFKKLTLLALLWTFGLIVLGAYVRLSDAGLGCPDWPGCYGKPTPLHAIEEISAAHAEAPHGNVSMAKAWKEMVHRYAASLLGLLLIGLAVLAVVWRRRLDQSPALPLGLVVVVCIQGALGALTVTMLLKPAIVTSHLIGGLTTLGLLVWLAMRQQRWPSPGRAAAALRPWALLGLAVVSCQIILGGWVSTNYAAAVCSDFPTCQGAWLPQMDFRDAFHLVRELGQTPDGQLLSMANLTAIHWLHRVGALLTFCYLSWLSWRLWRARLLPGLTLLLMGALLLQLLLGVANVLLQLPLGLAVAHNAGAALLLCVAVALNYRLAQT
ncbi:COX15/CtaA family protein [Chitinimonas lacunae]|uniref:Heme A synthase n=1 Tax=Chitinimonas lacunae TaxID=1963018 RepID=A0ABV8MN60_9NEIS